MERGKGKGEKEKGKGTERKGERKNEEEENEGKEKGKREWEYCVAPAELFHRLYSKWKHTKLILSSATTKLSIP